ncbi:Lipoprotein [Bordetella muralis]
MKLIATLSASLILTACTTLDETVDSPPSATIESARSMSDVLDCINSAWVLQATVESAAIPGGQRLYTKDPDRIGPAHVAEIVQHGKGSIVRYWQNTHQNTHEFDDPVMGCTKG